MKPLPQAVEIPNLAPKTPQPITAPSAENQGQETPYQIPGYGSAPDPRMKEFHDAERAMRREGKEPDWSRFEGHDLERLKSLWENEKKRREMMDSGRIRREQWRQQFRQNQKE